MGMISFNGVNYPNNGSKVQNDDSATSFNALSIPTGQTIDSVLDTNFVSKTFLGNIVASGIQIGKANNVATITIDLGATPSSGYFGEVIIFNANQNLLGCVNFSQTIAYYKWAGGNVTCTPTVNGTVLTLTFSSTLWGTTIYMWAHN